MVKMSQQPQFYPFHSYELPSFAKLKGTNSNATRPLIQVIEEWMTHDVKWHEESPQFGLLLCTIISQNKFSKKRFSRKTENSQLATCT